jgi:uncharacterized glyoxalase superfamily protein PhnB
MANYRTLELKAFLPAQDFALSKAFYVALGFRLEELGDELAMFEHGAAKFLLHDSYDRAFAEHLQMHLMVEDVQSWWERARSVLPTYQLAPSDVADQPWGLRDFTFLDPSGVAWRIAQEIA